MLNTKIPFLEQMPDVAVRNIISLLPLQDYLNLAAAIPNLIDIPIKLKNALEPIVDSEQILNAMSYLDLLSRARSIRPKHPPNIDREVKFAVFNIDDLDTQNFFPKLSRSYNAILFTSNSHKSLEDIKKYVKNLNIPSKYHGSTWYVEKYFKRPKIAIYPMNHEGIDDNQAITMTQLDIGTKSALDSTTLDLSHLTQLNTLALNCKSKKLSINLPESLRRLDISLSHNLKNLKILNVKPSSAGNNVLETLKLYCPKDLNMVSSFIINGNISQCVLRDKRADQPESGSPEETIEVSFHMLTSTVGFNYIIHYPGLCHFSHFKKSVPNTTISNVNASEPAIERNML